MSTENQVARWTALGPFMNAKWDSLQETAPQIAARLAPTLTAIGAAMGGGMGWKEAHSDAAIDPDDETALEAIVAEQIYRDDHGDVFPQKGFALTVYGRSDNDTITLMLFVGSSVSGRRRASNKIHVTFASGPRSVEQVETILLVIATWWQPASIAATDHDTITLTADMVRFAPGIGQRMWLRDDVGTITAAPDGVRVEPVAGGTLLATDDSWSPQQVADTLKTTLAENNITTIPRGPQPG